MTDTTWNVRVTSSGPAAARVIARQQQFEIGVPLHFDAAYPGLTALETLLGAVGADLVNGLQVLARQRRLDVDRVEASVQGELNNALTYLGVVGETGHPGLRRIAVKLYVSTLAGEEAIQQAWQETLKRSPLVNTLSAAVTLELDLKIIL